MSSERFGRVGAGPDQAEPVAPRAARPGDVLGERFDSALILAARLHRGQSRKGSGAPYIAHLLGVASIVLEAGGDEDQAIAALLHDAAEDQGGEPTLELIRIQFGGRVAGIVEVLTDALGPPVPPWSERKEIALARLRTAPQDALLVALADKLYNAEALLRDYRLAGEDLWRRFRASPEQKLWYYGELAVLFQERVPGWMAERYAAVVSMLAAEISTAR